MRETRRIWIPQLIASFMLLGALNPDNPYGYYTLLRWVCCGIFTYLAFQAFLHERHKWAWAMGITAAIYNPLIRIHLTRELWSVINFATIGIAIASAIAMKVKWCEKAPSAVEGKLDAHHRGPRQDHASTMNPSQAAPGAVLQKKKQISREEVQVFLRSPEAVKMTPEEILSLEVDVSLAKREIDARKIYRHAVEEDLKALLLSEEGKQITDIQLMVRKAEIHLRRREESIASLAKASVTDSLRSFISDSPELDDDERYDRFYSIFSQHPKTSLSGVF